MIERLRPSRFHRPVRLGLFIRAFLLGKAPLGSRKIAPGKGAVIQDIHGEYSQAVIKLRAQRLAEKKAIPMEEAMSRVGKRAPMHTASFHTYFFTLKKLGWVEPTGVTEKSQLQDYYPEGPPRTYYRLTATGKAAPESQWLDPRKAAYPGIS